MNLKLRKMLVLSLCLASVTGFTSLASAAYTLNPEVKNATPALKQAAEKGYLNA